MITLSCVKTNRVTGVESHNGLTLYKGQLNAKHVRLISYPPEIHPLPDFAVLDCIIYNQIIQYTKASVYSYKVIFISTTLTGYIIH